MSKKKTFAKIIWLSLFCFIISFFATSVGMVYYSLPDSYAIPETVLSNVIKTSNNLNSEDIISSDLSIHYLELGNKYAGDCMLIKVDDVEILVDAGSKLNSVTTIRSYLQRFCTDGTLEYIIVTHAHEDHYAGFATSNFSDSVFYGYNVETLIKFAKTNKTETGRDKMFKNFMNNIGQLRNKNGTNTTIYNALECYLNQNGAKRTYELGNSVELEFLTHKFYTDTATTENNYSVCFQINQNEKHFLFTGDLEEEGEISLCESQELEHCVTFKAGHHGSKTSTCKELLRDITPDIIVVTCCAGSPEYTSKTANQFPTQAFINNVAECATNAKVYITSLCIDYNKNDIKSFNGDIVICSSSTTSSVDTVFSNNDTELKNSDWFKANRVVPTLWVV